MIFFRINEALVYWKNKFTSLTIYDPFILDLNGDGIKTTTLDDGVYFDHNGDNVSFKTSWVYKDDALLVLDKNLDNQMLYVDNKATIPDDYFFPNIFPKSTTPSPLTLITMVKSPL